MPKLAYVLPIALALACGGSTFHEKAQHSLATALVSTNAARDVFTSWDIEHQRDLVSSAGGDADVAAAKVAAYREKRVAVLRAFTVAYSALAAAATALAAATTQSEKLDVTALLADAISATLDCKRALDALVDKESP